MVWVFAGSTIGFAGNPGLYQGTPSTASSSLYLPQTLAVSTAPVNQWAFLFKPQIALGRVVGRAKLAREQAAALARSRELLLAHLTPAQRKTFEEKNWFVVTGGQYRRSIPHPD